MCEFQNCNASLTHSGEYICECKQFIFAANSPKMIRLARRMPGEKGGREGGEGGREGGEGGWWREGWWGGREGGREVGREGRGGEERGGREGRREGKGGRGGGGRERNNNLTLLRNSTFDK